MKLDIRPVAPRDRFDELMASFDALRAGEQLEITFDHEPRCLMYALDALRGANSHRFAMTQLDDETWRADVEKLS